MNTIRLLHETAMQFYDEAKIAKIKGETESYKRHLEKAFLLEKEAALKIPVEAGSQWSRPVLLRSAASMAYLLEDYSAVQELVENGLAHNPPNLVQYQLDELLKKVADKRKAEVKLEEVKQRISGILIFANADENLIIIKIGKKKETYMPLFVPSEMMDDVVVSFWKKPVDIEVKRGPEGAMVLQRIHLAA